MRLDTNAWPNPKPNTKEEEEACGEAATTARNGMTDPVSGISCDDERLSRDAVAPSAAPPRAGCGWTSSVVVAWAALIVSVVAMSSGGAWFAVLHDTPPVLKASWRLLLTSTMQVPGFIWQWRRANAEILAKWRAQVILLSLTGVVLAIHFATWSWSIDHTSLAHSLLFVCTTPLILVAAYSMRYCVGRVQARQWGPAANTLDAGASRTDCRAAQHPTLLETVGTCVGFGAAVLLASAAGAHTGEDAQGVEPSVAGDLVALVGAAMMGIYLVVGARLRQWMPLFLYAFPVSLIASLVLLCLAAVLEPSVKMSGLGPSSVFGFFGSPERFGLSFGAALGAGILGHTLCNFALEHISSLIVSVTLLLEPLIGSVIGWVVGVQGVPDATTFAAGPVLLLGALMVTLGGRESAVNARVDALIDTCCAQRRQRMQLHDVDAVDVDVDRDGGLR